ncbi:hypothetical protein CBS147333_3410 [Penicillium roqueforti]|nr:hypothetical protein CBS147354_6117 [Penicillium roqueforti]KAI3112902.1 hypothetical protein CBS147333_3410 [Penicillium roqueforti]KAI3122184.1 hypothetical protein CBS147326_8936 [Penicillium roqueforti]KAI3199549.1 hypothetical protein CBS147311_5883 [Penicillium roqueforti]KAI3292767.1 hypothetical protein DTO002I6_5125 [Penicillium roqueforti]
MANQVTLLAYLLQAPPSILVRDVGQSKHNTTNAKYQPTDIHSFGDWTEFNINSIMHSFGPLLRAIRIQHDPIRSTSPQRELTSESGLHLAFGEYIHALIRRSLRCTFEHLDNRAVQRAESQDESQDEPQDEPQDESLLNQALDRVLDAISERTNVLIGVGSDAITLNQFIPDLSIYEAGEAGNRNILSPNRLPGDLKPSWKWSHSMRDTSRARDEFRKPLAQVNWYMTQYGTRFGFILTDQELVPIQRVNGDGNLKLGAPIPWTQTGTSKKPKLTVALGLWYLGMMAADDTQYRARQ